MWGSWWIVCLGARKSAGGALRIAHVDSGVCWRREGSEAILAEMEREFGAESKEMGLALFNLAGGR